MSERFLVEWIAQIGRLELVEPIEKEVREHAQALADFYNEPSNRALLTNTHNFTADDVVEQFAEMRALGGRPFLLKVEGEVVGDCDFRNVEGRAAEYAIMIGPRSSQAKGLGTCFSVMTLALAFERVGLDHVYASVRPDNMGSLRMLEKVGYVVDTSPAARRYAEEPDDVCVSIDAATFRRAHGDISTRVRIGIREL